MLETHLPAAQGEVHVLNRFAVFLGMAMLVSAFYTGLIADVSIARADDGSATGANRSSPGGEDTAAAVGRSNAPRPSKPTTSRQHQVGDGGPASPAAANPRSSTNSRESAAPNTGSPSDPAPIRTPRSATAQRQNLDEIANVSPSSQAERGRTIPARISADSGAPLPHDTASTIGTAPEDSPPAGPTRLGDPPADDEVSPAELAKRISHSTNLRDPAPDARNVSARPSADSDAVPARSTAEASTQTASSRTLASVDAYAATPALAETASIATIADSTPNGVLSSTKPAAIAPVANVTPQGLLSALGSVVLNLVVGALQLVSGPPVLPANTTVTVRTSSLTIPVTGLTGGQTVQANWYFPEDSDSATRLIYLQHGFLATGPMYSYTAANLAQSTNSIVVTPSLSSNFLDPNGAWLDGYQEEQGIANLFAGDRAALTESASAAAGRAVSLPERVVLVGHSGGGTTVLAAAGYMADNGAIDDLAGVVLLDPVNPAGSDAPERALTKLAGINAVPVYLISSPPYWLNREGDFASVLTSARPNQFDGVTLVGGRHLDYSQGGNQLLQFGSYLVGGFSQQQNIDAADIIAAGWINDMFAGTSTNGVYGTPGQAIPVATAAGPATAIRSTLEAATTERSRGRPSQRLVQLRRR